MVKSENHCTKKTRLGYLIYDFLRKVILCKIFSLLYKINHFKIARLVDPVFFFIFITHYVCRTDLASPGLLNKLAFSRCPCVYFYWTKVDCKQVTV